GRGGLGFIKNALGQKIPFSLVIAQQIDRPVHIVAETGQAEHVRFADVGEAKVGLAAQTFDEVRHVVAFGAVGIGAGIVEIKGAGTVCADVVAGEFILLVDAVVIGVIAVAPVLVLVGVPMFLKVERVDAVAVVIAAEESSEI